jgi:hypothetical protein
LRLSVFIAGASNSRWGRSTLKVVIAAFFSLSVSALSGFAQERKALTLDGVILLIQAGTSSARVSQVIETHGVAFELDEAALRRLRENQASEAVLSSVKKKAAQYGDEQQRQRREAAAAAKARQERQEKEAKARVERERREREAAAKAEKERQQKEAAAKAEQERQEKEAKPKVERERREREAAAKAERERQEREAQARADREIQEKKAVAKAKSQNSSIELKGRSILKEIPKAYSMNYGEILYIENDGRCSPGEVIKVIGGSRKRKIPRTFECVKSQQ